MIAPALALFDPSYPASLSVLARAGSLGARAHVFLHDHRDTAVHSPFCSGSSRSPSPEALDLFVPWLGERLDRGEIGFVVPSSDNVAYALSVLRDRLPQRQKALTPDLPTALDALFKDRFDRRCAALGMPGPPTWYPRSVEEAADLAPTLPYPVLLKPRAHIGLGMAERGRVVSSAAQLRDVFRPYPVVKGAERFAAAHPDLRWPMLQRFLAPPGWRNVSVCGFRHADGRVLAAMAVEKTGQSPPAVGVGSAFRVVVDPELVQAGVRLVGALGVTGMFEIEFQHSEGQRYAIDLNARTFGMINLPIACGLDLPQMWWRALCGEPLQAVRAQRSDLVWREQVPWHVAMWVALLRGPERGSLAQRYLHQLAQPSVGPIPPGAGRHTIWRHRMHMLRRLPDLLRNYLRAPRSSLIEYWS